jgi:phospholipid transport system transporter-binding protein
MDMQSSSNTTRSVALPADCTIRGIGVLHDTLRTARRGDSLDGSAVQRIDSAGLRLLVAFMHERRATGRTVAWQGISQVLSEAARKVGLVEAIRLPSFR